MCSPVIPIGVEDSRLLSATLCANSLFYHSVSPLYRTKLFRFRLLPVRTRFFLCKGIATENHSSTAVLFEHNFSVAFPIFNRSYVAYAPYRNCKILPKFLACFSLKAISNARKKSNPDWKSLKASEKREKKNMMFNYLISKL